MRGEKRCKEIEKELEQLETQLNLKLISQSAFTKAYDRLILEMDQIVYKDCKKELKEIEEDIKQLERHNERLTREYLIYMAQDKKLLRLVDDVMKINYRGIKRAKKFRTSLLNMMKTISKNI